MKKLDLNLITVANKPKAGKVVIWDSDSLILNTHFDLTELTQKIVFKEALVAKTNSLLNERDSLLALAIAHNRRNSEEHASIMDKVRNIESVLANHDRKFLTQVKVLSSFDLSTLIPKEEEAQRMLQMLSDYIVDLEVLRLNSYILITNLNDAANTVENLEETTLLYRDKVNELYNELLDLENRVNLTMYQLAVLKTRMDPAVNSMYKLRVNAYDLLAKYRIIWQRLLKLEIAIAENFKKLCLAESLLSLLRSKVNLLLALLSDLEKRMEVCITRLLKLNTILSDIQLTMLDTARLADGIADWIIKMTGFINSGLIQSGENVQVEYLPSGHAVIHAHLEDYPPREVEQQQCFPKTAKKVEYPAPPCPPVIPPCPTTTKKPDPPPACNINEGANGGSGTTVKKYSFAPWSGTVTISYDMLKVPDSMQVSIDGKRVAGTNGKVSGTGTLSFDYPGSGTVEVKVEGSGVGTVWNYSIKCS